MANDDDNVVPVDFGASLNEARRQFARLFDLAKEQREDLERNPLAYLEAASNRMAELQREMQKAYDALRHKPPVLRVSEFDQFSQHSLRAPDVRITHEDYERLKRLEQVVMGWAPNYCT